MDTQPTSANQPNPNVGPVGPRPEALTPNDARLEVSAAEIAPMPGLGSTQPAATPAPAPKLSADDVAAALAAVPAPTGPLPGMAQAAPAVADDIDVIEPEWVEKAEEVVRSHVGDPYGEEEAIEHLQQDYMQKRYGIKVADPNGENSKPEGK